MIKESNGIIINLSSFSETSAVVTILSEDFGIISGLAKGAKRKQNISTYQIGNLVYFKWFGKDDVLGVVSCELIKGYSFLLMSDRKKLAVLNIVLYLIYSVFLSGVIPDKIFKATKRLFDLLIKINNDKEICELFYKMEMFIFKKAGFEKKNLTYIFNEILSREVPDELIRNYKIVS